MNRLEALEKALEAAKRYIDSRHLEGGEGMSVEKSNVNTSRFYSSRTIVKKWPLITQWKFPIGSQNVTLHFESEDSVTLSSEDMESLTEMIALMKRSLVRAESYKNSIIDYEI